MTLEEKLQKLKDRIPDGDLVGVSDKPVSYTHLDVYKRQT